MHKSRPQEAATAHWPRHTPHCRQFTPHHRNLWFHTHQCYTVKPCSVAHMPLCCKSFPDLIEVFDACSTWNFGKRYSNWRRTYLGIGTFAKGRLNLVLMYWNMLLHLYRSDAGGIWSKSSWSVISQGVNRQAAQQADFSAQHQSRPCIKHIYIEST